MSESARSGQPGRSTVPRVVALGLILAGASLFACEGRQEPPPAGPSEEAPPANPLYVDPASYDFGANPRLVEKLRSSAHRYFRFINVPFSREVCRRFADEAAGAPSLNLHGDAHLEQYAVTDLGRGLTDFDDSSIGPAVVDLVRFGTSLHLACGEEDCGEAPEALLDEMLRGYRAALADPEIDTPEPRLAAAKRQGFRQDREGFYGFVDSTMEPVPEAERAELEAALEPYFQAMLEDEGDLDADFFAVERLGYLRMGVGSALDLKYLVRVRGASADPLDDVVLQVKQVRDLKGIPCIRTDPGADPLRVLRGHLRIARRPFRFLGYARFKGRNFWAHAWVENYSELEIEEAFAAPGELAEIAYDVGVQLGHGHPVETAAQLARQVRREQSRLVDRDAAKIHAACRELARQVVEAWERFKAAL